MFEEQNNFVSYYYNTNNNCWNMHSENLEDIYSKTVLLDVTQNKEQCQYEKFNMSKEKKKLEELSNPETADLHHATSKKLHMSTLNKTSRTVPNILKNRTRLHKISEADTAKTNCSSKDVTNTEEHAQISFIPYTASEQSPTKNNFVNNQTICRNISRRKQKLNFVDIWYELPNWRICSTVDDNKKLLDKASKQRKKLKHRNQNKKQKISVLRNEQKDELLSPMSHNVLTDPIFDCQVPSFLPDIESKDFQDSVDFSSNEIFNQLNYEFYNNSNSDCFTQCTSNFDETCTSLSTIYDNNIYEKEHDINDNEIDTYETVVYCSLTKNKQDKKNISVTESAMSSEYGSEDLPLFSDKTSKCSSNACCDYCYEDCVSNWIATSGASIFTKNKLLTETHNETSQNDLNSSHLRTFKDDVHLIDDTLRKYKSKKICSSVTEVESSSQCIDDIDSILAEFMNYSNEESTETEIFEQTTHKQKQEEYNLPSDSETDSASEQEMQDQCDTDMSQIQVNNKHSTNKKKFQCLSCSLTFSNARTMAIHRAGAHGGTYVILCEYCGRLFNQKYHFNRHSIDCSRLREPFKCDMCMKKYRHKSSLVYHLKVVHHVPYTRNRSTKFTCTVCNKVYSKFGAFENHTKTHQEEW